MCYILVFVSGFFFVPVEKTEKALRVHRPGFISFNSHNGK